MSIDTFVVKNKVIDKIIFINSSFRDALLIFKKYLQINILW